MISTGRGHGYPLDACNAKSAQLKCWSDTLSTQISKEMMITPVLRLSKQNMAIACGPMVALATEGYAKYFLKYSTRLA